MTLMLMTRMLLVTVTLNVIHSNPSSSDSYGPYDIPFNKNEDKKFGPFS